MKAAAYDDIVMQLKREIEMYRPTGRCWWKNSLWKKQFNLRTDREEPRQRNDESYERTRLL